MADTNLLILAREFKTLRNHVQEVLKMPVGPQGLQGEKGEQGVKGDTGAPGKNGKDGKDGVNGLNGSNGIDGKDGEDGKDGLDGVGVQNAYIDFDNSLVIVLTSGQEINAGFLSQETKDAVVATFKQGAQTLNELLPVQTGNANKFLKTDGSNVSWDTLDGSDINLASPPVIGGTTPNAATFTTLTATGQTSLGGTAGSESFRALNLASSVNWIESKGSIAGTGASGIPTLFVNGSDTTTQLGIGVKGASGYIKFFTSGAIGTEQFRVSGTASAVNYVQATGGATGLRPTISAQGSDSSIALDIQAKGTAGYVNIDSFRANYLRVQGSSTNGGIATLSTQGVDTNISQVFQSKGTGAIDLAAGSSGVNISNGGTVTAITSTNIGASYTSFPSVVISAPTTAGGVQATASVAGMISNNPVTVASGGTGYTVGDTLTVVGGTSISGAATLTVNSVSGGVITAVFNLNFAGYTVLPANPVSVTGGTGSGATFNLTYSLRSASGFTITNAGSGYVEQPTVTFSGGGGSGAAAYASVGVGTVIRSLGSTGIQSLDFYTPSSTSGGVPALRIRDTTNDSYSMLQGGIGFTAIIAQGNAGSSMNIASNGSGLLTLNTNGTSLIRQMAVAHTASAVNYVQVTGAATGGRPTISAQGSDTNLGLGLTTKGNGRHVFFNNNSTTSIQFSVGLAGTSTAVNYLNANGTVATTSPELTAEGTDTNLDIRLTPKGTGNVRFGAYTGTVSAITGYIEIKDAGGTIRRLAVVA